MEECREFHRTLIVFDIEWKKFRKAVLYMKNYVENNPELPRPLVTEDIGWKDAVEAFEKIPPKNSGLTTKIVVFEVFAEREGIRGFTESN